MDKAKRSFSPFRNSSEKSVRKKYYQNEFQNNQDLYKNTDNLLF